MKKGFLGMRMVLTYLVLIAFFLGAGASFAVGKEAVNLMLKNDSSSSVEVEMIDQYGGNFTATVEPGTSQNHTLKVQSEVKVGGHSVHIVVPEDEGKVVTVAAQ